MYCVIITAIVIIGAIPYQRRSSISVCMATLQQHAHLENTTKSYNK